MEEVAGQRSFQEEWHKGPNSIEKPKIQKKYKAETMGKNIGASGTRPHEMKLNSSFDKYYISDIVQ